jgi:hypothetical protein
MLQSLDDIIEAATSLVSPDSRAIGIDLRRYAFPVPDSNRSDQPFSCSEG